MSTFAYATGYGPTGNAFAFGIVQDNNHPGLPFTPIDHSFNYVVVTAAPEPGTLALFGLGAVGTRFLRRRTARAV